MLTISPALPRLASRVDAVHKVTVRVPAKVNLQLAVGPLNDDGFHDLVTVFHAVSLYDDVVAQEVPKGDGVSVHVEGAHSENVPVGLDNLAARAAELLAESFNVMPDVNLLLRKGIPVAGGMAGGSADAAGALVACASLWGLSASKDELHDLAAQLGSDVPFALHGGTAVGRGRGDELTPALARGEYHWVFALSHGGLSTPSVYRRIDEIRSDRKIAEPSLSADLMHALGSGDAEALGRALTNDLQAAALSLKPGLRLTLDAGQHAGALGAIVSGSGPTCAFLARDEEHALDLAVDLSASGTCRTVVRAHGPVGGAKIVSN